MRLRATTRCLAAAGVLSFVLPLIALRSAAATPRQTAGGRQDAALREALRTGRYEEVIEALTGPARARRVDADRARLLLRALLAVGRYDETIETARALATELPAGAVQFELGRALAARGRLEEAEAAWAVAEAQGPPAVRLRARLARAELDLHTGRREEGYARAASFIDLYNRGEARDAATLTAVGAACVLLGARDPQLFHDAVRAFDEAIAADPGDPEPRLRLGLLFLDKYDSGQAQDLIAEALRIDPRSPEALLADARRLEFDGAPDALARARAALEVNPNFVPARLAVARMLLTAERLEEASREIERALEVDPGSREAWATRAALRFVRGDREGFESAMARALAIDPAYGDGYRLVAEVAVQHRLYAEAVELANRGVELDPTAWAARGTLGINQLRIGQIEQGRRNLEMAFRGDPFNVWYKNTLDLLDTFGEYRTVATEHFDLFLPRDRADLLALYMGPLAEEALATLTERYGVAPPGRVRVEVYRRHADFSVRTVGLAGIGALGVTFGPVVAVDAPAAPGMGEFNWGATLWHEIAHVVTMTATHHRVPRWLTEGLSVFEERHARPGWGEEIDPGFLLAWLQGKLLPVARINDGFVRPSYPEQVGHSYLHASLLCALIDEEFGFDALRDLLGAYERRLDTPAALREVLGLTPEQLDARFAAYLERHYGQQIEALRPAVERTTGLGSPPSAPATDRRRAAAAREQELRAALARAPDDYLAVLELGVMLYEQRRDEEAAELLQRARRLFPQHADGSSAYGYLARLYEQRNSPERAAEALRAMAAYNEGAYEARLHLAELYERLQRPADAARVLQEAMYVNPYDPAVHERLAALLEAQDRFGDAVRERRAVVALAPADRAEALYRLAAAQFRAGDLTGARRNVLLALERAPGYAPAQELLLRLRRRGRSTEVRR